ncbi:hypothetical protein G4V62_16445 [Bacillaceae bacterium SIJ1]|uniref:hypothetical protein n=1 Tax=Litoribacterium kuwaitense TaxID=1398745 RepID=UPI0013EAF384|nr:hypothetical protein [Litoribacterium kuwaitense]NGP46460.1 hypothetical protein [Litoribacterium kuwaitense]
MSKRNLGGIIFGIATLIIILYTMYKLISGKEVGFNEISSIAIGMMIFFSTITWGSKQEKDGIYPDEELGQKITEKSAKISYFILLVIILIAVAVDQLVNGTVNIFLLAVLALAMITLPLVEFLVAKKYH